MIFKFVLLCFLVFYTTYQRFWSQMKSFWIHNFQQKIPQLVKRPGRKTKKWLIPSA